MTERQLEERLRAALEHAAPNDVEGVLSRCAPRQGGSLWPLPPALCWL